MYKVLCDGALMCDSRIEELALINPVANLEENKAGSFSFTIAPVHPKHNALQRRKSIIQVYDIQDKVEELLFSGVCIEVKEDFYKQKRIYCEGELTYFNDSIQRTAKYQGTIRGYLELLVSNHNSQVEDEKRFQVGIVTVHDNNDYIYCYTNMESTMKCLKEDLIDDFGGIIRIRRENGVKYIDYLAESPNTNLQAIRLGKNLVDFSSNIDTTDIATAIIPLGAKLETSAVEGLETRLTIESVNNGKDYVYSESAVSNFGWIYKVVIFDDVTNPNNLKAKAEEYLESVQFENVVIEAKAVDMHLTDKSIERFKISDEILVISEPHGLNKRFRLTKQILNLDNPEKDLVTLGKNEVLSLSAKTASVQGKLEHKTNSILSEAIANATAIINAASKGYIYDVHDEQGNRIEQLIMDTNDINTAKRVWRFNMNGIGYSNNGYKGPFATAWTMDGHFVADAITVDGLEVGKNVKMGANATISWENVSDHPTIPANTSDLNNDSNYTTMGAVENKGYQDATQVTKITKDTVTSAFIKTLNLVVGNEISMGPDAKISWGNVTGTDDVAKTSDIPTKTSELKNDSNYAKTSDIPTDEYMTQISKNAITSAFIKTLNLVVGKEIQMGEDATISWDNVTDTEGVAKTSDIPKNVSELENDSKYTTMSAVENKGYQDATQVTKITKDTVTTEFVNALKVIAGSVAAENITGTTIAGKTVSGGKITQPGTGFEFDIVGGQLSGGYTNEGKTYLDFTNRTAGVCGALLFANNLFSIITPKLYMNNVDDGVVYPAQTVNITIDGKTMYFINGILCGYA